MARSDYLSRCLATMPPHVAILRAVECRLMGEPELPGPVLDIGTGDGCFAAAAYMRPVDIGVDVRPAASAEAGARGPSVYRSVAAADVTALPFRSGMFHSVVSNCALEHVPDDATALREIARVLRPGGQLLATLPSERFGELLGVTTAARALGLRRCADAYAAFFNRISHHVHVVGPEVWRHRMAAAGLEVVDHRYYFSARAHRAFDLCHYLAVPNLVARLLSGRWVPHPAMARPYERWLGRYYSEPLPQPIGAYQYLRSVKAG
ncbi:MAG: class I SAM-dependent methyltransferase [Microthrixaceae bacterium]